MSRMNDVRRQAGAAFQRMAPRERLGVGAGVALIALALLWWVAIGPALATLRQADAEHQRLEAQLQRMRSLQAQAKALQNQPRQNTEDTQRALDAAVRQTLGAAGRMAVVGDRVTVTLTAVQPDTLAQWLTQARVNARTLPSDARLVRNAAGGWDGTVTLSLPPR